MTNVKKVVAVLLAFLMIFSSASVLASAWDASTDDGTSLNIETKFFKEVGNEWVETTKVKPGNTVEARVYLGTDYYSNNSSLLFFYDKDFFTHSYSTAPTTYTDTVVNTANSFVTTNGVEARVMADPSLSTLISNGYIDSAFAADYGAISVVLNLSDATNNVMYDNGDYILAFTFTVSSTASGEGDFFVKDTTVQSKTNKKATVNVPKGPADGTNIDVWAMRLWDADVTLNSNPVSTESSVTFKANGGMFADGTDTYVAEGAIDSAIVKTAIPEVTQAGYAFMGWIDAADATPTYEEVIEVPATIPEKDLVLNAFWMETVDIIVDADGGYFDNDPSIKTKEFLGVAPYAEFAEVATPRKDGYTFKGWDVKGNMNLPAEYPTVDTTYKAIWAKNVTVSFDTDGADAIAPIDGVAGDAFNYTIDDPSKAGHYFVMWSPKLPTEFPAEDTTYTAIFDTYSYKVTYYLDGKYKADVMIEYGMPVPTVVPTLSINKGTVLDGWYTDEACTQKFDSSKPMDVVTDPDGLKLYAKTSPAPFKAYFYSDNELFAEINTVYEGEIADPGIPVKEGYVFTGWDPYPGTHDEPNDMTFNAVWTEAENTIIYVVDGKQYDKFTNVAFGADLEVAADPDKEGYTFLGWSTTEGATDPEVLPEKMPSDNVTFYAVFKINTYKVTFNTADGAFEDGSKTTFENYEYAEDVAKPGVPVLTGYTFAAWVDDATGKEYADELPAMAANDVTYTAKYDINSYDVTWKFDNGDEDQVDPYDYKAPVTKPADPEKTGYTFTGWSDGENFYAKGTEVPAMGASDITYTAQYDINSYDVTWKFDNGAEDQVDPYDFEAPVTKPADPEKTGYTFTGWSDGTNFYAKGTEVPAMGAADITYTAKYDINSYDVTWKFDNGAEDQVDPYNFEAPVIKPADPEKTGYIFTGWSDGTNFYAKGTEVPAMGAADITYTAKYDINSYDVTWKFDNGDEDQVDPYDYKAPVTKPADPEKTGYTFTGWSDGTNFYAKGTEVPAMGAADITYTAQYDINRYTVTWIYDDDVTTDKVDTYEFNAKITAPADPDKKVGHKFLAWSPEVATNMPAQNLVYTATWEALPYDAKFDANEGAWEDGDTVKTVSTIYGQQIVKPEKDPVRAGYVFANWEPEVGIMNNVAGITFTAKWNKATDTPYKVITHTMETDGVTYKESVANEAGTTGDPVDATPTSVEPGFVYNADKSTATGNILANGNLELHIYIDRVTYTFTSNVDGEKENVPVVFGATIPTPATPSKVGYEFAAWSPAIPATMPANDLEVTATWTANTDTEYKIVVNYTDAATGVVADEYFFNGTTAYAIEIVDSIPDPEAADTIYHLKSDFAVENYILDEANSDLTGTVLADGSAVLNLNYVPVKYKATFITVGANENHDGAFADDSTSFEVTLDYNTLVKPSAPTEIPERTGYTFVQWKGLNDATRLQGDRTFEAEWDAKEYKITWNNDGKTDTVPYDCDALINIPAAGTKEGHEFLGWAATAGSETPADIPETMPANNLEFYAIWKIQQYTVTFYNEKDGAVLDTVKADYGTEHTVPTPSKTGYEFDTWMNAATDTAVSFVDNKYTIPEGGAAYYATWDINRYTITFDSNDGTAVAPITQDYDTAITAPTAPQKSGYNFLGWSLTDGEGAVVENLPEKMPAENRTYYAVWEANEYTITFDSQDGTEVPAVKAPYLSKVDEPTAPTKEGYIFSGWATTAGETDPSKKVSFPVEVPLNGTTYFAIWVPEQYTIVFDSQDGTAVPSKTQDYKSSVTAPTAPTKEGYTFGGWATAAGVTDAAQAVKFPVEMPLGGTTYYAIWTIESYNVTWVSDGEVKKTETVNYGADLTPPAVEKKGYRFISWTNLADSTVAPSKMNDIGDTGAAVTYTAVWEAKPYTATFDANKGAWKDGDTVKTFTVNFDAPITPPENPERSGYDFSKWNPTPDKMTEENMTFVAEWIADTDTKYVVETYTMDTTGVHQLTSTETKGAATDTVVDVKPGSVAEGFVLNDELSVYSGRVSADEVLTLKIYLDRVQKTVTVKVDDKEQSSETYYYGATVIVPALEVKEGYAFSGWTVNGKAYEAGASFEMPATDVEIAGTFTIQQYTVSFDSKGGSAVESVTANYGTEVNEPTSTMDGYTLIGWSETDGGTEKVSFPVTIPEGGKTYYAIWDANEYAIVFNAGEGAWGTDKTHEVKADYLTKIDAPAEPTRDGYSFKGWATAPNVTEPSMAVTFPVDMPLNGTQYYAIWVINQYSVKFYEDAEMTKLLQETNNNYGSAIVPPVATLEGHSLVSWIDAATGEEIAAEGFSKATPASDVTYYAKWIPNKYTLNFRANGGKFDDGKDVKVYQVVFGTAKADIEVPENPKMDGWTFAGWDSEVPATMPAKTVNIQATWDQETYNVSWISDGKNLAGTSDEFPATAVFEDEFVAPEMEKKGYTFGGWLYNGTTYAAGESIIIADAGENNATLNIEAQWTANVYVATFDANKGAWADGDTVKTFDVAFDAPITAPANPDRAGYTFNSWAPTVDTMTEENMTFTAQWIAKGDTVYTVFTHTMNVDGGYDVESKQYAGETDADVDVTPATVPTGFVLNTTNSKLAGKIAADNSLELHIYLDRVSSAVTVKVDGEVKSETTALYGAKVTVPALEVKEGYTFSGWTVNGTAYEANATFDMPAEAVVIEGTFKVNQYDAKFFVDGVLFETVPTNFGEVPVAPDATNAKPGYTFTGWEPALAAMTVAGAEYNATFEANTDTAYKVEIYEMDLSGNYGAAIDTIDKTGETDTTATFVPETREGFKAETVSGTITADGGLVLKVYYERQKFDVTYTVDGETYNTKEYYFGAAVDATLAKPTKDGYTFSGWSAEAPATMPANDVVISGTFSINTYNVNYVVDGEPYDSTPVVYNELATVIAEPTKTGYSFSGWKTEGGVEYKKDDTFTMPANDVTLSGEFSKNTYTITYKVDGEVHKVESYEFDAPVTALDAPVKEGHTFSGWSVAAPEKMPAENLVIEGSFKVNQYDAKFFIDGVLFETVPTNFGEVPVAPDATNAKPGYTFKSWDPALSEMTVAGAEYNAIFEANDGIKYVVKTHKMDIGGETYTVTEEEFTGVAGDTAKYVVKTYTGFTFEKGTNYDKDTNTVSDKINGNGSTVLDVYYTRDIVKVTINGETDDYYYGEEITEPTRPTPPTGNEQPTTDGWEDEDGNKINFPITAPSEDIVITPVFVPSIFVATFVFDDGSTQDKEIAFGSVIEAPAAPAKNGYKFIGWANSKGEFLKKDVTTMPASNVTYTAIYEIETAGVNYYVDGKLVASLSYEYGKEIPTTVPGYTVPVGYTFDGWYTDAECTQAFAGANFGEGVTDLYAKTVAIEYDAIFDAAGGTFADGNGTYTVKVPFDSDIKAPADPVREGYTFSGWDPYVGTMDQQGITFTAQWIETANAYTITYMVEGETYQVFPIELNAELEVPAEPDVKGKTFVKWATADGKTIEDFAAMPAENLTFYAEFTVNNYTVTFYDYEATDATPYKSADPTRLVATKTDYHYNDDVQFPAAPEVVSDAYWTFLGWSTEVDGEVIADTSAITVGEADAVYYAVYESVKVKLVPVEGSAAMVERDGVVESYNDGYSVTDTIYEEPDNYYNYFIYGITERRMNERTFAKYVTVRGDGELIITKSEYGYGTGTKIEVYDNTQGKVVETFYVVIFGDLNGDGVMNNTDIGIMNKEATGKTGWQRDRTLRYLFRAADLNGDGRRINNTDLSIHKKFLGGSITIDQTIGHN